MSEPLWTAVIVLCLVPADPEELQDADAGGRGALGAGALHCHHHSQDARADVVPLGGADGWWCLQPVGVTPREGAGG